MDFPYITSNVPFFEDLADKLLKYAAMQT